MKKYLPLIAATALICLLAFIVKIGLDRPVISESVSSRLLEKWTTNWQNGDLETIQLGQDSFAALLKNTGKTPPPSLPVKITADPGKYLLELYFADTADKTDFVFDITIPENNYKIPVKLKKGTANLNAKYPVPALSTFIPVSVGSSGSLTVLITPQKGSWAKPTSAKLTGNLKFNPIKAVYLLVFRKRFLGIAIVLVLVAAAAITGYKSNLKQAVFSAIAITMCIGFTLVLCEMVFRAYIIMVPQARHLNSTNDQTQSRNHTFISMIEPTADLDIVFKLKPNLKGKFAKKNLSTNSSGMRGEEITLEKPKDTIRIVGLGDSVMFGWGVEYEETALYQAARLIEEKTGRKVETINLGCPSYNTAIEVNTYRKIARKYNPDFVVLIFLNNDLNFPGIMIEPVRFFNMKKSYLKEQICRSLAPFWPDAPRLDEELVSGRHTAPLAKKTNDKLTAKERWYKNVETYYNDMVGKSAVQSYLNELATMLKEDKINGLVVYDPVVFELDKPQTYEEHTDFVINTARQAGLGAIDMTPYYEDYLRKNDHKSMKALWFTPTDWHSNAVAHQIMAKKISEYFIKNENLTKNTNS